MWLVLLKPTERDSWKERSSVLIDIVDVHVTAGSADRQRRDFEVRDLEGVDHISPRQRQRALLSPAYLI